MARLEIDDFAYWSMRDTCINDVYMHMEENISHCHFPIQICSDGI